VARVRTAGERNAVHLLPAFDEYFIGYQNRDLTIDPADFEKVVPGGNGVFAPVLVSHGRVIGTWRRSQTTKRVTVEPRPFAGIGAPQRARIGRGIAAYGRFTGLPGELV
jgi:winged helix DNA-binding protein